MDDEFPQKFLEAFQRVEAFRREMDAIGIETRPERSDDIVTSTTAQDIYREASQHNILVRDLETTGRNWSCNLYDAMYPARDRACPRGYSKDGLLQRIKLYADERERWVVTYEAAQNTQQETAPAVPQIIELPPDDDAAYEQGYNDGLTEGMRLTGAGVAPPLPASMAPAAQAANEASVKALVEQARREGILEGHQQAAAAERQAGYDEGFDDGCRRAEQIIAEDNKKIAALETTLQEIEKTFVESAATSTVALLASNEKIKELYNWMNTFSPATDTTRMDEQREAYGKYLTAIKKRNGV